MPSVACQSLCVTLIAGGLIASPAFAQRPASPGIVAHRDLAYVEDGHERQKLDLYLPERADDSSEAAAPLPVIVWVHGGGWEGGNKAWCPPVSAGFVGRGYAAVSIGYRLTDAAPFPAQIEDCRAALRWLRAHADEYGLDKNRIGAWGASAGGHLVALLGTAGDETSFDVGEHRDESARVQAVCDYFGPTDFAAFAAAPGYEAVSGPTGPVAKLLGGPLSERTEVAAKASPVEFVSPDDPPFLMLHGTEDPLVPLSQSERLYAALQQAGVPTTLIVFPGIGHGGGPFNSTQTTNRIAAFFDRHLKSAEAE
ncbi:alpha/beta hydrolase [Alienimonas chondri]|uniref:BD-FAE-like domain-containing protein n=1 Tax=Alienimonas chondri TaxID=2681879 RepID=A0ABX1VKP2_9PLAN|nr:alpha/beta hydrolase [Alienimonas chondri]NNJ27271.1 hypothetical protein [Alienimonas chondri]